MIRVALCGYGYWGRNLLRAFVQHTGFEVVAVADGRETQREIVSKNFPSIQLYTSAEEAIADKNVDAVAIVTPVASHYSLAKLALEKGKHVLVEKPICETVEQAEELTTLAKAK